MQTDLKKIICSFQNSFFELIIKAIIQFFVNFFLEIIKNFMMIQKMIGNWNMNELYSRSFDS